MPSEPEAWRRAAERLDSTPSDMPFSSTPEALGVYEDTWHQMESRILDYADPCTGLAYDGNTRENRAACVIACLWMALEAEDELAARVPEKNGGETT